MHAAKRFESGPIDFYLIKQAYYPAIMLGQSASAL